MINSTSNLSENIRFSLDNLLNVLGFQFWEEMVNQFVLPVVNLIGLASCSLSAYVFSKRSQFKDSIFVYYRVLTFTYILILTLNIPSGICFSPRFFPSMSSYLCAIYFVIYDALNIFLFHYCSVLETCILLTRMKIFSPFVKKHFSISPQACSFIFLILCLLIDLVFFFIATAGPKGQYEQKYAGSVQKKTFYYYVDSQFAKTNIGKLTSTLAYVLNVILSLIVGIILNVVSIIKYKSYLKKKETIKRSRAMARSSFYPTSKLSQKENRGENFMFFMAFTLCTVSIISKITITIGFACFFFFYSFSDMLWVITLFNVVYAFVPTSSVFIFYFFNKKFRREFKNTINLTDNVSISGIKLEQRV